MAAEKKNRHSERSHQRGKKIEFSKDIVLSRNQLIITLLQETGITPNELVHLRAEDVDVRSSSLIIRPEFTKNKIQRTVPLSLVLARTLKQRTTTGYLFATPQGNLCTRMVRKIVASHAQTTGNNVTARDLRKNYIRTAAQTTPVATIKEQAGLQRLDDKKILREEEFQKIRAYATTLQEKLFLDIFYETGCTLKELTTIRVKDIEFTTASLTLRERRMPLSRQLQHELRAYLSQEERLPDAFLFSTRQSATISEKRVYQIIRRLSDQAGILGHSRMIRNGFVSRALARTRSIPQVAEETGIKHLEKFHHYGLLGGGYD
jgi:integrase